MFEIFLGSLVIETGVLFHLKGLEDWGRKNKRQESEKHRF